MAISLTEMKAGKLESRNTLFFLYSWFYILIYFKKVFRIILPLNF